MPDEKNDGSPPKEESSAGEEAGESWLASDRVQALANVLTIAVALTAICLSIWQGYETRVSNRLAVIPNLDAQPATAGLTPSINSEYFPLASSLGIDSVGVAEFTLRNSGLGPAVIQNFMVFESEDKVYDAASQDESDWRSSLRSDLRKLPFEATVLQTPYGSGDMLTAGRTHSFLSVVIPAPAFADSSEASGWPPAVVRDSVLGRRSFVYCYCSVYEEDCGQVHLGSAPPEADVCDF